MTGYHILVASYTDCITTLLFDPVGPILKASSELKVGARPSWLTVHPSDPSLVFTGLEQHEGVVIALKYDRDGNGTIVGQIPSGGAHPASLLATADILFVGNYSSGTVLAVPLSTSPPYFPDDPLCANAANLLQLEGMGPRTDRQSSSHPHHIVSIPGRAELLIPDLGADRTWRVVHDRQPATAQTGSFTDKGNVVGTLILQGKVMYSPGSGPRHVVFHNEILYTLHELTSTLTAHHLPPLPAAPTLLSTTRTHRRPADEPVGDRLAAELLLAPALTKDREPSSSFFLYASNRNEPGPAGDTMAIFSLDEPGTPELVAEVHTGLRHLRGAAVSEDGRWVVLGGTNGGGVKVYERVDGGRSLHEVAALPEVKAPTAFLWL